MAEQPLPVAVITDRLKAMNHGFERQDQTAYAIIGALEQHGWVIVRKRHYSDKAP